VNAALRRGPFPFRFGALFLFAAAKNKRARSGAQSYFDTDVIAESRIEIAMRRSLTKSRVTTISPCTMKGV